jgi:hypothetical protein
MFSSRSTQKNASQLFGTTLLRKRRIIELRLTLNNPQKSLNGGKLIGTNFTATLLPDKLPQSISHIF